MQLSSLTDRRLESGVLRRLIGARRAVGLTLLSPLLGPFFLLLQRLQLIADDAFGTPELHFVVVTGAAMGAIAVAALLMRVACLRRDGRVLLIATGFVLLSLTFFTHAVATPGVLFANTLAATRWSTPVALLVGAGWLAASVSDRLAQSATLIRRWRYPVYGSLLAWFAYSSFMILFVPRTVTPSVSAQVAANIASDHGHAAAYAMPRDGATAVVADSVPAATTPGVPSSMAAVLDQMIPTAFPLLFGASALLYVGAGLVYGARWLRTPTRPLLALMSGSFLLAETAIAANYGTFGQAAFWLYHVLLVAAIVVVGYGVTVGVEKSGTLSSAVEGLLLGATLDRQRRAFHTGMAAFLDALEHRKTASLPGLRRELRDRFGLADDQLALLEHAVQLVAREREEQHRWRTLAEVSATVTHHLDTAELLRDSAATLAHSIGAEVCAIGSVADDEIAFAAEAIVRKAGNSVSACSVPISRFPDALIEGATPVLCDVTADQSPCGAPLNGAILAPLRHAHQLLGLLVLQLPLDTEVDERTLQLTAAVSAHLANGLASARLHHDLELKHERLQRSEQARMELTQMVAHDLKNPLTGVRGYLSLLEMGGLDADQRDLLGGAMRSSSVLLRLIDEMLDVARLEEGKLALKRVMCRADDLAQAAVDDMRPWLAQDGREIVVEVAGVAPTLWIDINLVRRVLVNLLSNALKYTPRNAELRLDIRPHAGVTEIVVADTGPGIPASQVPLLFERFHTSGARPERQSSTGLGLAFCKLAVEAHGGMITVESVEGQGTRFRLQLPATS